MFFFADSWAPCKAGHLYEESVMMVDMAKMMAREVVL